MKRSVGFGWIICLVFGLFVFSLSFSVTAFAAPAGYSITLKISHSQASIPVDNDKHGAAVRFKDIVEKQTNGAVKVEIYPLGQLYPDRDSVLAVANGTIFGAILGTDVLPPWERSTYIFQFPGLFTDKGNLERFLANERGGKEVEKRLMATGLFPAFFISGPSYFFTTKKAINTLADAKGLKLRCNESEILNRVIQAVGGSAVNMSSSEMYTAAQTGLIDGALTLPTAVTGRKLEEVFRFVMNDPAWTANTAGVSIASLKILEKMPSDIRKIVQDTWVLSGKQHSEIDQVKMNDASIKILAASGMTFTRLDPASKAAVIKTWQEQAASYGKRYGIENLYEEALRP
ncbi:MAG: TRAP transporter substrate-binding protein [Syntrophaceae bacterium]|nr:TRAP transporter substrate-binding protein [Syntrophaceae bacterium]